MTSTLKLVGLIATSIAAILGISSIVATLTVAEWLPPMQPTIYVGAALVIIIVILGGAWFIATREELEKGIGAEGASAEERGLQRLIGLTANVLLGVVALGVAASWNLDTVRVRFVDQSTSHKRLEKIFEDRSPLVRMKACEEVFKRGWVFRSKQTLISALDAEPAAAIKCLQTAQTNGWKGVDTTAATLNEGWMNAMLKSGAADAGRACELAGWNVEAAGMAGERPEPQLLHCATSAQDGAVRACCATTLAQRGALLEALGPAASFPWESTKKVFTKLVHFGFAPLSLPEQQQEVARVLGTDSEDVRRWIVEVGCGQLDPTVPQPEIIGALFPLIEADSCGLRPEEEAEYYAGAAWVRLCDEVLAMDPKEPVQQRVCTSVQNARVTKVMGIASLRIWEATRAPFAEQYSDFVTTGLAAAARIEAKSGSKGSKDPAKAARDAITNANKNFKFRPDWKTTCKKVVPDNFGPPGAVKVIDSTECTNSAGLLSQATDEQIAEWINNPATSPAVKKALKNRGGDANVGRARKKVKDIVKEQFRIGRERAMAAKRRK